MPERVEHGDCKTKLQTFVVQGTLTNIVSGLKEKKMKYSVDHDLFKISYGFWLVLVCWQCVLDAE